MYTHARSAKDLAHLVLPLTIMKDLRRLTFVLVNADMSTWAEDCDRLVRTGALRQARSLIRFRFSCASSIIEPDRPLGENYLWCAAYKSLLFQMPLDCALRSSVHGYVPENCCRELIARGANVNSVVDGVSVLQVAVKGQRIGAIRTLLAAGADPNHIKNGNDSWTTLESAMRRSSEGDDDTAVHVVKLLLEYGANAGYASSDGCNALHTAAENSTHQSWEVIRKITRILLDHDPTLVGGLWTLKKDKTCETPLITLMQCHTSSHASSDLPPGAAAVANILADAEARHRFNERERR